ncbi:SDR family NAD(P)-dependent oxidoreductase, partial [Robertmurraya sp. DFI.2.37]|uniref:SDR family NAD(P)-dependent oxidoreductase n=1 Tax=Robertmurraya sp. DFI.2.37 TaxID=3031819 RepID=UPI0023DBDDDC
MDLGLKGKSVLVLASSKGLGKAIAQEFVREGARVMFTSRDALALQTVARGMREVSGEVQAQPCDITKLTDIKELVEKTVS